MVIVISLSRIAVTLCRLASSLCLQKRTRLDSHGVMYSKQRCFNSIPGKKILLVEMVNNNYIKNHFKYCFKLFQIIFKIKRLEEKIKGKDHYLKWK